MIELKLVSYELAVKLKNNLKFANGSDNIWFKGKDGPKCVKGFMVNNQLGSDVSSEGDIDYEAPTLEVVRQYLDVYHKIYIDIHSWGTINHGDQRYYDASVTIFNQDDTLKEIKVDIIGTNNKDGNNALEAAINYIIDNNLY